MNTLFGVGRKKVSKKHLNSVKGGKFSKFVKNIFHDFIEFGKKLLEYLVVRHLISRKILGKNNLLLGGRFSWR